MAGDILIVSGCLVVILMFLAIGLGPSRAEQQRRSEEFHRRWDRFVRHGEGTAEHVRDAMRGR